MGTNLFSERMERNTPGGYYKLIKKTLLALTLVMYSEYVEKLRRILPAVRVGVPSSLENLPKIGGLGG
jgi:hypothetical protein